MDEKISGIQVIGRAATILRLLGEHPAGLSLGSIATRIELARSTVQRIVQALEAEGFVELSGPAGGFRLGPSLARLVYRRQMDIVSEVHPFLEALAAELGETVGLYTFTGNSITTIDRCVAEQPLRVVFPLGTIPYPAHNFAPGRAILAELPTDRAMEILAADMSQESAERELAAIMAERDRARDTETYIAGLSGFAVPLRTYLGLYAIAAILPASRVADREDAIFSGLQVARESVEGRIG